MDRPVVSIIGKPNVGKSTLFNRLIGKRVSITEDTPGITRDRIYQPAEWTGHNFYLVDTGGIDLETKETMNQSILSQAIRAAEDSDVILFVVDGKKGMTYEDENLAFELRKLSKPVILVVNKIDSKKAEENIYEFYTLGFENIVSVSAEQALGLGDLLDEIVARFPEKISTDEVENHTRISIIGKPNVGKSSLVNRLLNEDRMIVTAVAGTTRDSIDSEITYNGARYTLIDTAGIRRKRSIDEAVERYSVSRSFDAIDRSHIAILVIDATAGVTEQDSKIIGYAHDAGKAMIILVNKWDLIEKDNTSYKNFEDRIRTQLSFLPYVPILFVSVRTGQRIHRLMETVQAVENNYYLRVRTGILNQIITDAILYSPPPTDKGKRLKILYAMQASVGPPKFLLFVNDKELMHFSYLRYLENRIRQSFGFMGVPLTFELRNRKE